MTRASPRAGVPSFPFSRPRKRSAGDFPARPTRVHPSAVLAASGYSFSGIDDLVVSWLNVNALRPLGIRLATGSFDGPRGSRRRRIGTFQRRFSWREPPYFLRDGFSGGTCRFPTFATFVVLAAVFGGPATGQGWLAGGPGFHFSSGASSSARSSGERTRYFSPDGDRPVDLRHRARVLTFV